MSKSKYPNKLDTSAEIQHVRDNITEIGSDVVNSIRSAIFQIEKTLGTNPQGAAGNTVSNRLNRTLDDKGNIKKEALDRANILSGPIIDSDVSKVAAIQESKLRLDFPTQLLQDEVSILNRQIESIIAKVDELNYILSTHVSPEATNRHKAKAITVEEDPGAGSSSFASTSFAEQDLQSFINDLYSSHINYTGESISSVNRSHEANQVFFDRSNVPDIVKRESVQGAIEDIADLEGVALRDNTLNLNSNGIIRSGSIIDSYEGFGTGSEAVGLSEVNYEAITGKSTTRFYFTEQPAPIESIDEFDILTVSGSSIDENNKTGSRSRFLRIKPGVYSTAPFVHEHWEEVFLFEGDMIVGNDANGDGGEHFHAPTYACRPPGVFHGPFKSEGGCVMFELHYFYKPEA